MNYTYTIICNISTLLHKFMYKYSLVYKLSTYIYKFRCIYVVENRLFLNKKSTELSLITRDIWGVSMLVVSTRFT